MSTDPRRAEAPLATDSEPPESPEPPEEEAIRDEIEHIREDLGETVNALSKKTDVKAQASRASAKTVPVIAGAIALLVVAWIVRRRRNR